MKADFEKIKNIVAVYEGEKRFAHTLAVINEAEYISRKCLFSNEKREKTLLAALLHDITKKFSESEQKEMFRKYGIDVPASAPTMHEKTGAYFAREIFGADTVDDEVFSAIYCHTTGKENMSMTDMAVFIADYTEETRKHTACREMREYLHEKCEKIDSDRSAEALLRNVTLRIIDNTLCYLLSQKQQIDIGTVKARNSMILDQGVTSER